MNITFIPLTELHFPLLLKWLLAPHVKKWWDQDVAWTPELIQGKYGDYVKGYKQIDDMQRPVKAYIICMDDQPIGYIQLYNAYDFPRSRQLAGLPENLGAFDIFIGEEKYLRKGIGSAVITKFLTEYACQYSHILADPDQDNIAAIRAYEKAGFKKIGAQFNSNEVWMIRDKGFL